MKTTTVSNAYFSNFYFWYWYGRARGLGRGAV